MTHTLSKLFSSSPPVVLDNLSDDLLCRIFSRLPLEVVLDVLDRVCVRWGWLKMIVCEQTTQVSLCIGLKGSLTCSSSQLTLAERDAIKCTRLNLPALTNQNIWWLDTTFLLLSNLTLIYIISSHDQIVTLSQLIWQFSDRLSTLKLHLTFSELHITCAAREKLLHAINSCLRLRHLTFHLNGYLFTFWRSKPIDLNLFINERLEELFFCARDQFYLQTLCQLLRDSKRRRNLKRIGLSVQTRTDQETVLQLDSLLSNRIVYLDVIEPDLGNLGSKFSNLETLIIRHKEDNSDNSELSMSHLVPLLSKFTKLITLKIELPSEIKVIKEYSSRASLQLSTVKFLSLRMDTKRHTDLAYLDLEWIFPEMKSVEILFSSHRCWICGFDDKARSKSDTARRKECINQLLAAVRPPNCVRLVKRHFSIHYAPEQQYHHHQHQPKGGRSV